MTQPKPEAPLYLEDLMARISGSERVIVETAARQVIYRGYAANQARICYNPEPA